MDLFKNSPPLTGDLALLIMNTQKQPTLIGLDLGGTQLKSFIRSFEGTEDTAEISWPNKNKSTILNQLVQVIEPHLDSDSTPCIGIAVPGFLSADRLKVIRLSNLPQLNGVELIEELKSSLDASREVHWILDTDTNAGLWAESQLGPGESYDRVFYVSLGTGLGGAMVIDGQIVRNANHTVGQIAHIPIGKNRLGAESLLSAKGLLSRVSEGIPPPISTPLELFHLANEDSEQGQHAQKIFDDFGRDLGELLGILGNLFSPEIFILGGGLSRAFEHFQSTCQNECNSFLRSDLEEKIEIVRSRYDGFSGARGAALLSSH